MDHATVRQTRRRGHPKGVADESQATQARRERMRRAQEAFRRRRKLNHEAQEERLLAQDRIIDEMGSTFVGFADFILHSDYYRQDLHIIQKLRDAMAQFVQLGAALPALMEQEHVLSHVSGENERTVAEEELVVQSHSVVNELLPTSWSYHNLTIPGNRDDNLSPINRHQPPPQSETLLSLDQPQNIFGNGWQDRVPEPFLALGNHDPPHPWQEHTFTAKLLRYSLWTAYNSLSGSLDFSAEIAQHIFQFALPFHTKDELLFNLRWFLGPGHQEIFRLGYANFNPGISTDMTELRPLDFASRHQLVPAVDAYALAENTKTAGRFINASDVEIYLRRKGAQFLDSDVIEISYIPTSQHGDSIDLDANMSFDESHLNFSPDVLERPTTSHSINTNDEGAREVYANPLAATENSTSATVKLWDFFSFNTFLGNTGGKPSFQTVSGSRQSQNFQITRGNQLTGRRKYRLRSSLLIESLARISACLGKGPGYEQNEIEKAITRAIICD